LGNAQLAHKLSNIKNMGIPPFNQRGFLPPGEHKLDSWEELVERFGTTRRRQRLLVGLKRVLLNLQQAGCQKVYLDGSFVTKKGKPNDYDGFWESEKVNPEKLDSILLDNSLEGCREQKKKYGGELLTADTRAVNGQTIYGYYTIDVERGITKGIVCVELQLVDLQLWF
jgi:hypothetical protein